MSCAVKLVRGDTRPQLKFTINDENTGTFVDITGATVLLKFRAAGSSTILFTRTGVLLTGLDQADGSITYDPPYNVAGAGGRVAFDFAAGNLDLDAGAYEGELEVTFYGGGVQTVYNPQKFTIRDDF
jgi:hypothetical protein